MEFFRGKRESDRRGRHASELPPTALASSMNSIASSRADIVLPFTVGNNSVKSVDK